MAFGRRVRDLLVEKGYSQAELAQLVGAKQQTISYLLKEGSPAKYSRYGPKIAEVLGVNPVWLQSGEGARDTPIVPAAQNRDTDTELTYVPVLAQEDVEKFVNNKTFVVRGAIMTETRCVSTFAFEVADSSMVPTFNVGDVVVIDREVEPMAGDYAVALIDETTVVFRRYRSRRGGFELTPDNSDWETVESTDTVRILGTMIEHRRYRKSR